VSLVSGLKKHGVVGVVILLWIPAVGFGISKLLKYSTTPGQAAIAPFDWPRDAPIESPSSMAALVMFAHPQCGCSRASLGELAIIMAHSRNRLSASVFFYKPRGEQGESTRSELWEMAKAIPGVRVFEDINASVAKSFGVFTSGQTLLYDRTGRLLFKGGITAFRGHSGDNPGRSAITALLQGDARGKSDFPLTTPVFGCSLRGE
jgi:hypothetical protein